VERRNTLPGVVQLRAADVDRIRIHAGEPVRGTCMNHRFLYTRGDIDLLPAGYSDEWQEDDAGSSLLVELPAGLLRRAAEDMGVASDGVGLDARHGFRDAQIEHIVFALDAHRHEGRPSGLLFEESLGLALAVHLVGRFRAPRPAARGFSGPQRRRVLDFIEAHLSEPLTLDRLASVAGTSASHLKTLFKRSMGVPVHQYVVQRRVERARVLLEGGALPLAEVALEAGFSHQSHMARCMRRALGITPGELARARRAS